MAIHHWPGKCLLLVRTTIEQLRRFSQSHAFLPPSEISLASQLEQRKLAAGELAVEQVVTRVAELEKEKSEGTQETPYVQETRRMLAAVHEKTNSVEVQISECRRQMRRQCDESAEQLRKLQLKWEFERDSQKLRHCLSPLLMSGYTQPARGTEHEKTAVKQPFSVSALRRIGALERSPEGLKRLMYTVKATSNDRGIGAFPVWLESDQSSYQHEFLLAAQGMLLKYEELLIEQRTACSLSWQCVAGCHPFQFAQTLLRPRGNAGTKLRCWSPAVP